MKVFYTEIYEKKVCGHFFYIVAPKKDTTNVEKGKGKQYDHNQYG